MSSRSLLLLLLVLLAGIFCFSQDASTGAIRVIVEDPSGGRVPAAAVTVVHVATGVKRGFLTDQEGVSTAQLLPPGEYVSKPAAWRRRCTAASS